MVEFEQKQQQEEGNANDKAESEENPRITKIVKFVPHSHEEEQEKGIPAITTEATDIQEGLFLIGSLSSPLADVSEFTNH